MKTISHGARILVLLALALTPRAGADISIPGADGLDGPLNVTTNTVIDLSKAVTAAWNANGVGSATRGIYDSNKWAVVFRYSSVNIAAGATLTFANHPSRAPVVWLVSGSLTNAGTINLNGENENSSDVRLPEPGPGGFRGGAKSDATRGTGSGSGLGPGGGEEVSFGDGVFGTGYIRSYGKPELVPLFGGSGGTGLSDNGSPGGGAILIAVSGTASLEPSGAITANGGNSTIYYSYVGSGGAVRIVADKLLGSGTIETKGGWNSSGGHFGGLGRIRLEANVASSNLNLTPATVAVSPSPVVIWPDSTAPTVRLTFIDNKPAPFDPRANMDAAGDDLRISTTTTNVITLETSNFPITGRVNVYIKPRNAQQSILQASYVSGTSNLATWQLKTVLMPNHTVIQARAVAP